MSFMNWSQYSDAVAITTSDTASNNFMDVYVGGAGNVKVTTAKGTDVTFSGVPVGFKIGIEVSKVWSTGTTATNLVGFRP